LARDEKAIALLRRAQLAAGGISDLAARLDVAVFDLARWMEGEASPPPEVLARAREIAGAEDREG